MRIVCISDTHLQGDKIAELPAGDVLIHAGDHTWKGTQEQVIQAMAWLNSLSYPHILLISGNHDFFFDERFPNGHKFRDWRIERTTSVADLVAAFPRLTYLQDSGVEIDGIKFYGSPWQPWYYNWAFNFGRYDGEDAREVWGKIPDDVNVLITHGPPFGVLDTADDLDKKGCPHLKSRLTQLNALRLHVFGHIHEGYGQLEYEADDGAKLTFVNAATCNIHYNPVNPPIVVEI